MKIGSEWQNHLGKTRRKFQTNWNNNERCNFLCFKRRSKCI